MLPDSESDFLVDSKKWLINARLKMTPESTEVNISAADDATDDVMEFDEE